MLVASPAPARGQGARRDEEKPEEKPPPKLTKPPKLLSAATPEYPPEALEQQLEASVKVRLHLDASGAVTRVDVVEPVGHGFDEAAVAAAEQYRFEPAEWDGVPGPIVVETKIHFVIEKVEEPEPPPLPKRPPEETPPEARGPPSHGGDFRAPVSIQGQAVERGSRKKLVGVIVSITELGMDAITDEQGRFFFHGVPAGNYTIVAIDDRYDRFTRTLRLEKGERIEVRLWMRARGGNPYETVVEGEREVLEVTKRTIERRQMTTVPGTFGDPIRVIQSLPGLARTPFISGFLLVRGSNPDDSGTFIDGHRIPLIFHFAGGPSILNPEFLESIDLYPGGFPARFGRSTGGVVAVETRSAKSDGVHGSADIDLLDASAYIRLPVGDHGAFALAGRRSYLDFMLDFFLPEPEPGDTLIVVPVYYDYQARLDYDFQREGKASLFLIGSSDTLDVLSQDAGDEEFFDLSTRVSFLRLIATYERPLWGDLRLTLSPAIGRDSVTFSGAQFEDSEAYSSIDITEDTASYRMRIHGKLSDRLVLDTGIDMESRVTKYDLLAPIIDDFRPLGNVDVDPEQFKLNIDMLAVGLHADMAWDFTNKLRLIPGLRLDSYLLSGQGRFFADPRLVARYAIDERWTAKGYAGVFSQPPQPEALDKQYGNPDLGLEHAVHVGLGGEWKPRRHWMLDGEVYYIDRNDEVRFSDRVETDPFTGEVSPLYYLNSGQGDTVGLEVLVKREVTRKLYGWLSYTLSKSRTRRTPDREYIPTIFDQRHTLNAVASYRTDGGWEIGGRFRLATGAPRTPIIGSTYDADDNRYDSLQGETRSARRKTFHQFDARAERTWVFKTWMFGLYLDVQNLFNVANEEAIQFDYRYRESAPVTGVPFVPTLGIRGQW